MITVVRLNNTTRQRLTKYGIYGDSMDSIVNRILDEIEKH